MMQYIGLVLLGFFGALALGWLSVPVIILLAAWYWAAFGDSE